MTDCNICNWEEKCGSCKHLMEKGGQCGGCHKQYEEAEEWPLVITWGFG